MSAYIHRQNCRCMNCLMAQAEVANRLRAERQSAKYKDHDHASSIARAIDIQNRQRALRQLADHTRHGDRPSDGLGAARGVMRALLFSAALIAASIALTTFGCARAHAETVNLPGIKDVHIQAIDWKKK